MISTFVLAWDANKERLREYFKTHDMKEYFEYKQLVRILFDGVINPYLVNVKGLEPYDVSEKEVTVIDNGHYQGSQLFALHLETYQPEAYDYVFTYHDYGSCSGCDTLMHIHDYEEGLPNDGQIEQFMTLCMHLLQRCIIPFNYNEDTLE